MKKFICLWSKLSHDVTRLHDTVLSTKLKNDKLTCDIASCERLSKRALEKLSTYEVGIYTLARIPTLKHRQDIPWDVIWNADNISYLLHPLTIFMVQAYRDTEKLRKLGSLYRMFSSITRVELFVLADLNLLGYESLNITRFRTPSISIENRQDIPKINSRPYDFIYVTGIKRFLIDYALVKRSIMQELSAREQKILLDIASLEEIKFSDYARLVVDSEIEEKNRKLSIKYLQVSKILTDRIYWIKFALNNNSIVITDQIGFVNIFKKNKDSLIMENVSYSNLLDLYTKARFNIIHQSAGQSIFTERLSDSMGCGTIPLLTSTDTTGFLSDGVDSIQKGYLRNKSNELRTLARDYNLVNLSDHTYFKAKNHLSYTAFAETIQEKL